MTLIYRVVAASTGTSCCWGGCNEPAHFDGHMMSNDRCCWMLLDAAECGGEEKPRQTMAENSDAGNCWSSTAEWLSIRRVFCVVDRRAAAMMRSMKLLEQQQQHLRGGCDRWWTIYWNQPQPLFFRCRSTVFSHLYCFVLFCRLIGWLICQHFQKNKRKKEKKKIKEYNKKKKRKLLRILKNSKEFSAGISIKIATWDIVICIAKTKALLVRFEQWIWGRAPRKQWIKDENYPLNATFSERVEMQSD